MLSQPRLLPVLLPLQVPLAMSHDSSKDATGAPMAPARNHVEKMHQIFGHETRTCAWHLYCCLSAHRLPSRQAKAMGCMQTRSAVAVA